MPPKPKINILALKHLWNLATEPDNSSHGKLTKDTIEMVINSLGVVEIQKKFLLKAAEKYAEDDLVDIKDLYEHLLGKPPPPPQPGRPGPPASKPEPPPGRLGPPASKAEQRRQRDEGLAEIYPQLAQIRSLKDEERKELKTIQGKNQKLYDIITDTKGQGGGYKKGTQKSRKSKKKSRKKRRKNKSKRKKRTKRKRSNRR